MKSRSVIFLFIGIFFSLISCKKDPKEYEKTFVLEYNPTPLKVAVPAFVTIYLGEMPVPETNPTTVQGVELGRKLFYENLLSNTKTISCASCHKQENAFDDPRSFSEGTNGSLGNRNAMACINLAWGKRFFWDGRRPDIELQAHDPVTNPVEMANTWPEVVQRLQNHPDYPGLFFKAFGSKTIDSNMVTKAIAQFERTLVSFNARFDQYHFEGKLTSLNQEEINGLNIYFGKAHCNDCHSDVLLTDNQIRNNGLDFNSVDKGLGAVSGNSSDNGKFKVPTLRNIAVTAPYMHDSRFKTLEQVVGFYNNGVRGGTPNLDEHMEPFKGGLNLTPNESRDLVAFLRTFTDETFLTNPAFSKPE